MDWWKYLTPSYQKECIEKGPTYIYNREPSSLTGREIEVIWQNSKDVHTEHCCARHGCKYGDPECSVALGIKKQSWNCETCDYEMHPTNELVQLMTWLKEKDYLTGEWESMLKEYYNK